MAAPPLDEPRMICIGCVPVPVVRVVNELLESVLLDVACGVWLFIDDRMISTVDFIFEW